VRRTLLWIVVALIALSAISAPTALAGDASGPAVGAAGSTFPATPGASGEPPGPSEPAPADPGPTEPAATESAAPQPDPVAPAPTGPGTAPAPTQPAPTSAGTEPEPTQPAPTEPATEAEPTEAAPTGAGTDAAPAGPSPTNPSPVDASPSEPVRGDPVSPEPAPEAPTSPAETESPSDAEHEAAPSTPDDDTDNTADESNLNLPASGGGSPGVVAIAHNRNIVFQVVWQVQEGCLTRCYGTSQSQSVIQWSSTTQTATAVAGGDGTNASGSSSASAEAHNVSITVQFVWQLQIGCVAFCYETSQVQSASQWAETIQTAIAEGDVEAWAETLSETLQYVWQIQEGCAHECHGVHQSQTTSQGQSTTQSATATAGHERAVTMIVVGPDGVIVLPAWLVALAANHGATIQTIYQRQQATCLEQCHGDAQLQNAIQQALNSQEAIAIAWVSAEEGEQPSPDQPSGQQAPVEQPQAEQPPGQEASVKQAQAQEPSRQQAPVERSSVERASLEHAAAPAPQPERSALSVSALAPLPRRASARAPHSDRPSDRSRRSRRSDARDASAEEDSPLTAPAVPPTGGGQRQPSPGMPTTDAAFVPIRSFPSADGRWPATPAVHDVEAFAPFDLTLEGTADDSVNLLVVALMAAALALLGAFGARRLADANLRPGAR
jgi:hypothetical protein